MQLSNPSPYHTLALPTLTRVRSGFSLPRIPTLAILSLQCKRKTVSAGSGANPNQSHVRRGAGHRPQLASITAAHLPRNPSATWGVQKQLTRHLLPGVTLLQGEQLDGLPPCQPGEPPREGSPQLRAASGRGVPPQSQLWGALVWPQPFGAVPVL